MRIYTRKKTAALFLFTIAAGGLLAITLSVKYLCIEKNFVEIATLAVVSPALMIMGIFAYFSELHLDSEGLIYASRISKWPNKRIIWGDIGAIVQHQNTPLKNVFRLALKPEKGGKYHNLGGSMAYQNHKDLVREIVLRVPSNTEVTISALVYTNLTKEDVGRYFGREITA